MLKFVLPLAMITSVATANLNQCMNEICGPAEKNHDFSYYMNSYIGSGLSSEQKKAVLAGFIASKDASINSYKKALDLSKSFEDKTYQKFLEVDKGIIAFMNLVLPSYGEIFMSAYNTGVDPMELKESELNDIFVANGADKELASLKAKAYMLVRTSNSASKAISILYSQNPEYHLGLMLGLSAEKPIIQIYHDLFAPLFMMYENNVEGSESGLLRSLAVGYKSYLTLGELSAEDTRNLNTFFSLALLESQYQEELKGGEKDGLWSFLLSEEVQKQTLAAVKKGIATSLDRDLDQTELVAAFVDSKNKCVAVLDKKIQKYPTKEEHQKFLNYYRGLVQSAKRFTNQKISYSMGRKVEDELSRVQIDLPPTQETYIDELVERFKIVSQTDVTSEWVAVGALSEEGTSGPFDRTLNLCEEDALDRPFYDHSTATDYILPTLKISWTTIRELDRFRGVVAHEVGHRLYEMYKGSSGPMSAFTSREFDNSVELFQCVSENYTEREEIRTTYSPIGEASVSKVSKYANEDFADQFAAYVDSNNQYNFACVFLSSEEGEYTDLSFLNPIEVDHHSANSFRVLNVERTRKGGLPESCEAALEEANQNLNMCI